MFGKDININNLTGRQVEMLDIMWSLEHYEDIEAWQATLDLEEREMSETLMRLILLELVDETINAVTKEDLTMARDYLKKFQL
jgi:hypothetical protein